MSFMRSSIAALLLVFGATALAQSNANRSRKIHNPAADARGCSRLVAKPGGQSGWQFVNNCPTAVEFFWCSGAECERDSGNTWTIRSGGSWPVTGRDVRWGACRGANSGGFDQGSKGHKYTCPNFK
ncbi:MAG TPA: hypothetical protein VM140_13885 [Burkholderiales bacterium]|nr:hypothetical protein [Burkholderiales bacterium]